MSPIILTQLYHGNHIDDTIKEWPTAKHQTHLEFHNSTPLLEFTQQTSQEDPSPPNVKKPTEGTFSFAGTMPQPISKSQES